MAAELRLIVAAAVADDPVPKEPGVKLAEPIRRRFAATGDADGLVIPPHGPGRPLPTFGN